MRSHASVRIGRVLVLLAALHMVAAGERPAVAQANPAVDWPAFLARQDLAWTTMPARWEEGAFLGNGLVGAMVFAGEPQALDWQLGRTDVTDHRDHPEPMLAAPRLPIGRLRLGLDAPPTRFDGRLDLWNAELTATLDTPRGSLRVRSFAHATRPVIVIQIDPAPAVSVPRLTFRPDLAVNHRLLARKMPLGESDLNPAPFLERAGDAFVSVQPRTSGGEFAVAWQDAAQPDGGRLVVASIADSHPGAGARREAAGAVAAAMSAGLETLRREHRAWWHAYYPLSFVSVPDPRIERFYWRQMYKLASATRADGLVIDNQGPWYNRTPWPGTWWNLNVQLSYWPVYTANRLAIGESLVRFLDRNRETLRRNVPAQQRDGLSMAIGRMSGPDGVSPVDVKGPWTPPNGAFELSNLVWVVHNVWLHWRHSMDEPLLRELLFPVLKGSVHYLLQRLEPGDDGRLHLPEAISPEYPVTARDTNYDLALLRWGCETLLALDARLGAGDPLAARWRDTLARLAPYPVGPNGYLVGRDVPFEKSHRHFSHLLMIYPLRMVAGDRDGERALIERSLAHWIGFDGALQGYSFVGASAISSLLGKGDDAIGYLSTLLEKYVHPNTMYTESGPVIDTPLAAAQAVHEMLLQSHGGIIRVFPALPSGWKDVTFHDLRAEGAFLVSAELAGGVVSRVRLQSLAGEPARLQVAMPGRPAVRGARGSIARAGDGSWRVGLARGEWVELVARP